MQGPLALRMLSGSLHTQPLRGHRFDLSGDGRVVVGASGGADARRQAFRWTQAEGLKALGVLAGGATSLARAASYDGPRRPA